jgi:hypothetical protein
MISAEFTKVRAKKTSRIGISQLSVVGRGEAFGR